MRISLKNTPLYILILVGMAAGIIIGFVAVKAGGTQIINDWVKPFGEVFMRLLKFIAIPLILISLIKGVANLGTVSSLSKLGLKTILIYISTTVVAIAIGLTLAKTICPGKVVSNESVAELKAKYDTAAAEKSMEATLVEDKGPLDFIVNIVPDNFTGAMSSNGNMLAVIFAALFFGIAILLVGKEAAAPLMKVVDSIDTVILKAVDIIMKYAPIGVAALMAGMVSDTAGDAKLIGALGLYALTVIAGLILIALVFYPLLIKFFSKIPVRKFLREMVPVQLLAFSTSSSASTLPLNMETAHKKLGISEKTVSFVLPVGMTVNMDGASCYQAVAAVFIAQVLGIDLGWQELLILVATTTISSIGTPAIPGGSIVIMVMVLTSIGIPPEGLALILGLDRPLDMLRTVVNVTGDAVVAALVDRTNAAD